MKKTSKANVAKVIGTSAAIVAVASVMGMSPGTMAVVITGAALAYIFS